MNKQRKQSTTGQMCIRDRCSAIISDTLLFRSRTCTPIDKMAATELAKIAEIDMDRYAADMFSAGSNLRGKSNDEIFYQDFKLFNSGKTSYGVGQISSLNADELVELKERLLPFLKKPHEEHGVDMIFFMLTNIPVSYTHLDVYKRQVIFPASLIRIRRSVQRGPDELPSVRLQDRRSSGVRPHGWC